MVGLQETHDFFPLLGKAARVRPDDDRDRGYHYTANGDLTEPDPIPRNQREFKNIRHRLQNLRVLDISVAKAHYCNTQRCVLTLGIKKLCNQLHSLEVLRLAGRTVEGNKGRVFCSESISELSLAHTIEGKFDDGYLPFHSPQAEFLTHIISNSPNLRTLTCPVFFRKWFLTFYFILYFYFQFFILTRNN